MPDAGGEPVRVKGLERLGLLPDAQIPDGRAAHRPERERGAAARVAVPSSSGEARHFEPLRVKRLGDLDRVLTGHASRTRSVSVGWDGLLNAGDLGHQILVTWSRPACPRSGDRIPRDPLRSRSLRERHGILCRAVQVDGHATTCRGLQLIDRRGAPQVSAATARAFRDPSRTSRLARARGLAGSLKLGHQHHGRAIGRKLGSCPPMRRRARKPARRTRS